jgi:cell division protein FtsA
MIANNPEYTTATALLLKGTENCAVIPEPVVTIKEPKPIIPEPSVVNQEPVLEDIEVKITEPEVKNPIRGGEKLKGENKKKKGISDFFGGLFDKASGTLDQMLDEQDD